MKTYMRLVHASLLYAPARSRDEHESEDKNSELPIKDYDRLTVEEITRRLRGLSTDEIKEIKAYEQYNKNRVTLIERFDRSLV